MSHIGFVTLEGWAAEPAADLVRLYSPGCASPAVLSLLSRNERSADRAAQHAAQRAFDERAGTAEQGDADHIADGADSGMSDEEPAGAPRAPGIRASARLRGAKRA